MDVCCDVSSATYWPPEQIIIWPTRCDYDTGGGAEQIQNSTMVKVGSLKCKYLSVKKAHDDNLCLHFYKGHAIFFKRFGSDGEKSSNFGFTVEKT
jgi:hypothetical protein